MSKDIKLGDVKYDMSGGKPKAYTVVNAVPDEDGYIVVEGEHGSLIPALPKQLCDTTQEILVRGVGRLEVELKAIKDQLAACG